VLPLDISLGLVVRCMDRAVQYEILNIVQATSKITHYSKQGVEVVVAGDRGVSVLL